MEAIDMIVTAIALGAAEGAKDSASQFIKDCYAGMKKRLCSYRNRDIDDAMDAVSKRPEIESIKSELVQALKNSNADKDKELIEIARKMLPEYNVDINKVDEIEMLEPPNVKIDHVKKITIVGKR